MDSFNSQLHADEFAKIATPTARDWAEYHAWLATQAEGEVEAIAYEWDEYNAYLDARGEDSDWVDDYADDYDGQPDEYTEWQDYMDGDDWDFGQYDE